MVHLLNMSTRAGQTSNNGCQNDLPSNDNCHNIYTINMWWESLSAKKNSGFDWKMGLSTELFALWVVSIS